MRADHRADDAAAAEGCPQHTGGLFVAIPSAATNLDRRNAIRRTWCRRAVRARVSFFVGGPATPALDAERAAHGDLVFVDVEDAATNVTAKLLASLHLFAARGNYTHYVRAEDDCYLFVDRLEFSLRGRPDEVRAAFFTDIIDYPRGFAVVLPATVATALARLDADVGFGLGSRGKGPRPRGAKGAWLRDRWWNDDTFLGLLLYPLNLVFAHDPRFHDLPGRGPNAAQLSLTSIAVNSVQTPAEFSAVHAGTPPTARNTWTRDGNTLRVRADVDGTPVNFQLAIGDHACARDAARAAARLCTHFPKLPPSECQNARVALLAVCDEASAPPALWPARHSRPREPGLVGASTAPLLDLE
ncbi:hypothetical protein CTAYLR_001100 [Chrysophaeum taylorii]|uniref:Hexosyltransferase n=1 Tax=Chrysophaeum taylorii TaxID=2483200 RepID=A0AAD7UP88_9STRA|nr:hypothetical protein CTAYLR_001100 [Chrysophaeum taylorii]